MANGTPDAVVAKLRNGRHAQTFRQVFGDDILDNEDTAFRAALMALEVFQQTPSEFYPYDSKYDAFLRKQVKLSPQEMRGLQVFADPAKGNCASCHERNQAGRRLSCVHRFRPHCGGRATQPHVGSQCRSGVL